MNNKPLILIVEDSPFDAKLISEELISAGLVHISKLVKSKSEFLKALEECSPDIILSDYNMPDFGALEALKIMRKRSPNTPVIVISGTVGEDVVVETIKLGAVDYVMKNKISKLSPAVKRALDQARSIRESAKAFKDSEERMRFALEVSHTGAWDLDLIDHTAFRSIEHDRIFGYTELLPEWTYEKFLEHVLPEDRDKVNLAFRQAIEKKTDWNFECRIRRADGLVRWILATGRHQFDSSGRMHRMAGIVRDITDRKELERELAETKDRQYNTLVENLPQKVFLKNKNSVYISCNRNYAKDLGINPEEIKGKTDYDFFPTHLAEKYRADDKRIIESGKIESIEEEFIAMKDFLRGVSKTFINTVKIPLQDKNGNITGVFGIFWDITEQKKLKETQERLVAIIESTSDFVGFADAKDKHVMYINKAGRKMCGLSNDEDVTKLKISDLHPEWVNKLLSKEILPAAARDGAWTGESAFLNARDRREIPVSMLLFSHKAASGEVEIFSTISRDMTEYKRMEAELINTEKMRISADMKSKFTSMVSHELRSPLSVIKESINLVLEGLIGNINDEQKGVLITAKNNTDRLSRLINNVLDFQKIEAGKVMLDIREGDINELIVETGKGMNILAEEKGLGFTVNIDEEIPRIGLDRDKIIQVVTNLLSNAIKFTEKGSISIETKMEGNVAHVMVRDTGIGIRQEDIPKLFETFEQLDKGVGRKRGGTGLGLAISKDIVLGHNGKIWAESRPGKGSTFHFTLPIKERRGHM